MRIDVQPREVSAEAIQRAPRRVEGHDKVMGRARYVGDYDATRLGKEFDVAVPVTSGQATGTILSIDAEQALASPGVRMVMTHENAPRLHKCMSFAGTEIGDILPLQSPTLYYAGQCIAVVIADTLEHARAAALLVRSSYSTPSLDKAFTLTQGERRMRAAKAVGEGDKGIVEIGNAEEAYKHAAVQVDLTFETSPHHHNAMEPAGIIAVWDDDGGLTVHLPSQFCYGDAVTLGQAFGFGLKDRLPRLVAQVLGGFQFDNKVRVITPLAGGAFGSKHSNNHLLIAPMAAKLNGRPVKLILTREQTFTMQPFRGATRQRMRLGADADGKLEAILQDPDMAQGAGGSYIEPTVENIVKAYACKNIQVRSRAARLDTNAAGWMRGPGASVGQFALDVAMDVLAEKVGIDPLEIRLRNYAEVDPSTGNEWSSKSLRQCYEVGAQRIGWHDRDPRIGSMREGRALVGYGMATSIYPTRQLPAVAQIILRPDGHAQVRTALHEIGQGGLTSMTGVAAERLGLPIANVHLEWGDTALPFGAMTVGSMAALSNGAAIAKASDLVVRALCAQAVKDPASSFYKMRAQDLKIVGQEIVGAGLVREFVVEAVQRLAEPIEKEAITGRDRGKSKYGRSAFGAQFVKVLVDPDTLHVQVDRLVGAFAGGRPLNPLMVHSQLIGGMVWGLGQAMMEETVIDPRTGLWMNGNFGEAHVPVNADIDNIEAIIIEEDDTRGHALGAKGVGEIGVVGTAAAVSSAIYHATGQRLCSLPMKVDDLVLMKHAAPETSQLAAHLS